ncbi:hypothetical protein ACFPRL_15740 [Pseudoclavibacter helvolus]
MSAKNAAAANRPTAMPYFVPVEMSSRLPCSTSSRTSFVRSLGMSVTSVPRLALDFGFALVRPMPGNGPRIGVFSDDSDMGVSLSAGSAG